MQIILGGLFLIACYLLSRWLMAKQIGRVARRVVAELNGRGALSPESAVPLPYAKKDWLKIGLKDYRPKAVEALVMAGVVGVTAAGAYYLARPEVLKS